MLHFTFQLYYGVNCLKDRYYQPVNLATKDIVITSYSVLKRELSYAEASQERFSRKGTRYLQPPSPLKCIKWWRICIDEAQMAESVTSKIAKMLCEVDAVNRWCITGTPAETRLSDFYGLLAFLRVEPFTSQHYWNALLHQPFLRTLRTSASDSKALASTMLVRLFSNLLFRNTKARVGAQLALPPIKTEFHLIKFTPAEEYIYRKILHECSKAIEQALIKWPNLNLTVPMTLHPSDFQSRILTSVTRARQACTHPSLVITSPRYVFTRGKKRLVESDPNETRLTLQVARTKNIYRKPYFYLLLNIYSSMTEVLRRVGNDEQVQCENLLRSWIANKAEAAACHIIKGEYEQAANCYRGVLKKANELASNFEIRADSCQILHAITNLHFLIENRHVKLENDSVPPTTPTECDDSGLGTSDYEESDHSPSSSKQLDPRVDRDLPRKANLIRWNYLKALNFVELC
ncbi:unnamed protein product [Rodentolepis nana]|uniref:SNF2-rel_dom domain-containing protein n=1 Tax=Rodentolepis nana TaxID=102285 RepID=A0A0R3U0K2_RODNA|nr:unnamed protein product [Rodentolepis nana]